MSSDIFQLLQRLKDIVIVFQGGRQTSLSYVYNKSFDVYICTKFSIFRDHLERLLHEQKAERRVHVILLFSDFQELLEVIMVLEKASTPESSKHYVEVYQSAYHHYLRQIQDGHLPEILTQVILLAKGQADRPLSFNLILLVDADVIKNADSFTSVNIQQKVRFIALKHGAPTISVSLPEAYFDNADNVAQMVEYLERTETTTGPSKQLVFSERVKAMPIFDAEGEEPVPNVHVHLLFPRGWDSWSKIQLLGTSLQCSGSEKLLTTPSEMAELNAQYDEVLSSTAENVEPSLEVLLQQFAPSSTIAIPSSTGPLVQESLTMQQLLLEVHNASNI